VLTLACLAVALRFILDRRASARAKVVVGLLTAASCLLPLDLPWYVAGVLCQLGVCLFVLFREKALGPVTPPAGPAPGRSTPPAGPAASRR
jgi:hypothetical protein